MDDLELSVVWKGKKTKMTLREEGEHIKGYVHEKTHVLTLAVDSSGDEPTVEESFKNTGLEYDADAANEAVVEALGADDEDGDEDEDEDEDEDDDASDDDSDEDEIEEDDDPDYGEEVEPAGIDGVPTLHAVMAVYGKDIAVDGDVRTVRGLLRTLQEKKIVNVSEHLLHGEDASGQGVLDAVAGIEPGEDDVVLFLYSGHGCMEEGDRLLCTRDKMLRREAVVKAVTAKSARLHVVLSDCCAVDAGKVAPEEKMGGAHKRLNAHNLHKLFRDYAGVFDVTSSANYQYSFGGVFTPTLFERVLLGDTPATWKEVFDKTQKLTMATADGALPDDAKKKLRQEGQKVEDHQMPVAYSIPS